MTAFLGIKKRNRKGLIGTNKEANDLEMAIIFDEVKIAEGKIKTVARVEVETAMPAQDERLPYEVEKITLRAGQQFMRGYYGATMELADRELILSMRAGQAGEGIRLMGKRRYTFITQFGRVPIKRTRIKHKATGSTEIPAKRIWQTPKQAMISQGLKNAVCSLVAKESFNSTVRQLERESGEAKLLSKTTVGNILKNEGRALAAAQQARAEQVFAADATATVLLGRAGAHIAENYFERTFLNGEELNSEADAERVFDQVMWDPYQELVKHQAHQAEPAPQPQLHQAQEQAEAPELEPEPAGKPAENNCAAVSEQGRVRDLEREREQISIEQVAEREPIAASIDEASIDKARADACGGVCAGAVGAKDVAAAVPIIAQLDEVVARKQPGDKRARVVHYNGSVKSGDHTYYCSGSTSTQLVYQVGAVLAQLGLHQGAPRLLVLSDCADWITNWANGIGIVEKEHRFCWWHLRHRCRELVGEGFTNKEDRDAVRKVLLQYLWRGQADKALTYVKQLIADYEDGISKLGVKGIKELEALKNYLIKRQPYIPDYQARRKNKESIASTQIEKFNDWSISTRCKGEGRRWSHAGVAAIAALETARRNGELAAWQQRRELPAWPAAA